MDATNDDVLFVEHALRRGLVTEDQVDEIVRIQEKVREMGVPDTIPSLMVKRGVMKPEDRDAVLAEIRPRARKEQIPGYRLMRRLGHGGMGSVYLARQVAMDRLVALKVLRPSLTKDEQQIERLRREAQLVGKLAHPNIVRGLDMGEAGGFHYFAMEYVEGETLKARLRLGRPMGEAEALKVVRSVAEALDHAWSQRIAHRDIKPGNIILRSDGTALVMDYGLAKGPLDVSLTQTGTTLGTPQYLSPEQARNPREVDIRTDVYALGATLFHMLTGKAPFNGENLAEIVTQVLLKPHDPPQSLNSKISTDTAFLIDKMMAKDPRHRHATPRDLLRDLDAIERGRSIVPAGWEGDWNSFLLKRRFRRLVTLTVVLTVLVVAVGAYLFWDSSRKQEQLRRENADNALATLLEGEPGFEHVEQRLEKLRELERLFGDIEPKFAVRRGEWEAILASRDRTRRVLERIASWAERDDFTGRRLALEELIEKDGGVPVVGEHLRVVMTDLAAEARGAAERALAELKDGTYTDIAVFLADAEALQARIARRWPAGWVDEKAVGEKLTHCVEGARILAGRLTEVAELERGEIDGLLEQGRFSDALDRLNPEIDRLTSAGNAEILAASQGVPGKIANLFVDTLNDAVDRILREDDRARKALVDEYEGLTDTSNDPAEYEKAAARLETRARTALKDSAEILRSLAERIRTEANRRSVEAEEAFRTKTDHDFRAWLRDRVGSAAKLLDEVESYDETVAGNRIAPWIADRLGHAREDLAYVQEFWKRLGDELRSRVGERTEEFIDTKGRGTGPVTIISFDGWKLRVRDDHGNESDWDIRDLRLDNAFEHAGLAGRSIKDEDESFGAIVRLLLVPVRYEDRRREIVRLQGLYALVKGRAPRYEAEFAAALRDHRAEQAKSELRAREVFERAEEDYRNGRWARAKEGFESLVGSTAYKNTKLCDDNRDSIRGYIELCEGRLEGEETSRRRFDGGRFRFLEGSRRVLANEALASVTWPLEENRERADLGLSPERARIVTVPGVEPEEVLGPHVQDEAGEPVPTARRALLLRQGDTVEEYLERHPIEIENPFLATLPMAIEMDVRSPAPVFMAVGLGGVVCGILSQEDRVEGGRGVVFWVAREFGDLDARKDMQFLRHPAKDEALARASSPLERLELLETRYFRMLPDRWYRLRFEKGSRTATLRMDGRLVGEWRVPTGLPLDRKRIVVLTYTTTLLDNLRIEGTVDRQWWQGR